MHHSVHNMVGRDEILLGKCTVDIPSMLAQIPIDEHIAVLYGEDAMYSEHSLLVGWGAMEVRSGVDNLPPMHGDWWFGHFNYDTHTPWTGMESRHQPVIGFPDCIFFRPRFVLRLTRGELRISFYEGDKTEAQAWWNAISAKCEIPARTKSILQLRATDTKEDYLQKAAQLQSHLLRGDIYEVNYCRFFMAEGSLSDNPIHDFCRWMKHTSAPFSAYYTTGNNHLLCASPERFLCKHRDQIIAQPIKGTTPRHEDPKVDEARKNHLRLSEKERAENVMIVDLMRNDLSQLATKNSVEVTELFGLYSFSQVHQMISTVKAQLRPEVKLRHILEATFPMGSMTGAPKRSAMNLIDAYETHRRELFSGSVGYISPNGNFDFNVVIRSLQYNTENKVSLAGVGSALTFLANPEAEYEECLWKLATINKIWSE